jgi:hypothetical protein
MAPPGLTKEELNKLGMRRSKDNRFMVPLDATEEQELDMVAETLRSVAEQRNNMHANRPAAAAAANECWRHVRFLEEQIVMLQRKLGLPAELPKPEPAAAEVNPPKKCTSCEERPILDALKAYGTGFMTVAKFLVGPKVDAAVYESRKAACQGCPLLKEMATGIFSCGDFFLRKPARDQATEGCGCLLNAKWAGKSQKCPLAEPRWTENV